MSDERRGTTGRRGRRLTGERGIPENNGRQEPRRGWRDMPVGGTVPVAGSSIEYETGDWRSIRPLHSKDRCINCLLCWVYCPDAAIMLQDGKVEGIDYVHCKGCGICAKECPQKVHAIEMVPEGRIKAMEAESGAAGVGTGAGAGVDQKEGDR